MGVTKIDELNTPTARLHIVSALPTSPSDYYETGNEGDVDSTEWRGGEMAFLSGDNRLYIQTNTSGTTASWKRTPDALVSA